VVDGVDFGTVVETLDDCVVVRVAGELDMATVASFETALRSVEGASHVVLDLGECTFLDSSGIGAIANAAAGVPRFSVVAAESSILRVLEITALDTRVRVYPSLDDAR
jgi:anti-sigma B factor antagonist